MFLSFESKQVSNDFWLLATNGDLKTCLVDIYHVPHVLSQNKLFLIIVGFQLLLVTLKLVWLTFIHIPEFCVKVLVSNNFLLPSPVCDSKTCMVDTGACS